MNLRAHRSIPSSILRHSFNRYFARPRKTTPLSPYGSAILMRLSVANRYNEQVP
jgi:hypothetical protein